MPQFRTPSKSMMVAAPFRSCCLGLVVYVTILTLNVDNVACFRSRHSRFFGPRIDVTAARLWEGPKGERTTTVPRLCKIATRVP